MKIKEKVLKEVPRNYDEWLALPEAENEPHKFIGDMATEKAIDLTLAEVGKVIEKRLDILNKSLEEETSKAPKYSSRRLAVLYSAIDELNKVKQKLRIK